MDVIIKIDCTGFQAQLADRVVYRENIERQEGRNTLLVFRLYMDLNECSYSQMRSDIESA